MINATRVCPLCGQPFSPRTSRPQRYCSRTCRAEVDRSRAPITVSRDLGLARGNAGAFGELLVALDLIGRGHYVFRTLTPHSPCDLIAFKRGGAPLRVEVKIGHLRRDGRPATISLKPAHEFDVLAVVLPDRSVLYVPDDRV